MLDASEERTYSDPRKGSMLLEYGPITPESTGDG